MNTICPLFKWKHKLAFRVAHIPGFFILFTYMRFELDHIYIWHVLAFSFCQEYWKPHEEA